MNISEIAAAAESASLKLAVARTDVKNNSLAEIAKDLKQHSDEIVSANKEDLVTAEKNNLAGPLLKRLKFDENKIADVCAGKR
jgi:glutamate-5-semialdehyde dehydrogenase